MNNNKRLIVKKILFFLILIIFPVMAIIISILISVSQKEFKLFPNPEFSKIEKYNIGNSSICDFYCTSNEVILDYILHEEFISNCAGFNIGRNSFFNIKPYDSIRIKIKTFNSKSIIIIILTQIKNYSYLENENTFLFLEKEIPVWEKKEEYILSLNDFYIPEWWTTHFLSEYDKKLNKDFSKVFKVSIRSGRFNKLNEKATIILEEISFFKNKKKVIISICITFIVYCLIILIIFLLYKYKEKVKSSMNRIIIPYKFIKLENDLNDEERKIIKYLGENYNNSSLTLNNAGYYSGLPASKIPNILKKRFNLTFPQYLNAIRLCEAKRLLVKTDRQISDIAYNIGFKNVCHFIRIFKSIEKISPLAYRKKINNKRFY